MAHSESKIATHSLLRETIPSRGIEIILFALVGGSLLIAITLVAINGRTSFDPWFFQLLSDYLWIGLTVLLIRFGIPGNIASFSAHTKTTAELIPDPRQTARDMLSGRISPELIEFLLSSLPEHQCRALKEAFISAIEERANDPSVASIVDVAAAMRQRFRR